LSFTADAGLAAAITVKKHVRMNLLPRPLPVLLLLIATAAMAIPKHAAAQDPAPRFGVGLNSLLSSADGFGIGFRGRASAPVNRDVSVAIDLGFTGFVLNGRRDADYIFDPQLSAIVSLPYRTDRLTYLLFGLGGYVPVGPDSANDQNGPTIHFGVGWVHALNETSLFYEIDPALIIGEERADIAIPFRIGLIF
jgi:hypothetical protein